MAKMYHEKDADVALIRAKKVAIIGYGSQGDPHALSLKDSGVDVRVGLPASSESRAKAKASGLTVGTPAEVSAGPTSSWCWCRIQSLPRSTRKTSRPT